MPKIIRILRSCSMKIFSKFLTVNISKRHLCIAKNFIWTTLKAIFSIFVFFYAPSDSRYSNSYILSKYPNKPHNGKLIIQLADDV